MTGTDDHSPAPPDDRGGFPFGDRDDSVRRVQLFAVAALLLSTVGIGLVTRSAWQVLGILATGSLMLLNFQGLISVTDAILNRNEARPSGLQMAFLLGRYALLGIVLCAIVLAPGVGPVPVALGLSILVIAILLEAILQLFPGSSSRQ